MNFLQTFVAPLENKEVMTDFVEPVPIERSQTRTLVRHDDFDEDDDDRDVITVDNGDTADINVDYSPAERSNKDLGEHLEEGFSDSMAPSRATTDPASSLLRDSGFSDVTGGSRNFTPGLSQKDKFIDNIV